MQRSLAALVCLGGFAMDFHVLSETVTKIVHVFRFTPVMFVCLDCVEEGLLSQLSLIVPRAITVTAQARSHLFLSGIRANGDQGLLLAICHPRGLSTPFGVLLLRGEAHDAHPHES